MLDLGLAEEQFWNMTLAELNRFVDSQQRIYKREAQEKAMYDYILAELIGRSVARIHSKDNVFPSIEDAYPTIFDKAEMEEKKAQRELELSVLKLHQITNSLNNKFKKEEKAVKDE